MRATVEINRQIVGLRIEWNEVLQLLGGLVPTWASASTPEWHSRLSVVYQEGCRYKMKHDLSQQIRTSSYSRLIRLKR